MSLSVRLAPFLINLPLMDLYAVYWTAYSHFHQGCGFAIWH